MIARWFFALVLAATPALADPDHRQIAEASVDELILPASAGFRAASAELETRTEACMTQGLDPIRQGYHALWDAWLPLSVYRFGPLEVDNRALQIAFWPDKKGFTPRTLKQMIAEADPVVLDAQAFAQISIAGRGLFALEWMLFENVETGGYACDLITAIARDIGRIAGMIDEEWRTEWSRHMIGAGAEGNAVLRSKEEATQRLFGALVGALTETIDLRLARPLGTVDRPRPLRAEAWRSERALPNIKGVVAASDQLYRTAFRPHLSQQSQDEIDTAFAGVASALVPISEVAPLAAAVDGPGWIRVSALEAALVGLRDLLTDLLGPELGVSSGFNARDGD